MSTADEFTYLTFRLRRDKSGWPPAETESMPFRQIAADRYKATVPPLFVKGLSVGDVIKATTNGEGEVLRWRHVEKSRRSTIWIMTFEGASIEDVLQAMLAKNCNVERLPAFGHVSVDVPETVSESELSQVLEPLDDRDVACAYPSYRHDRGDPPPRRNRSA